MQVSPWEPDPARGDNNGLDEPFTHEDTTPIYDDQSKSEDWHHYLCAYMNIMYSNLLEYNEQGECGVNMSSGRVRRFSLGSGVLWNLDYVEYTIPIKIFV